jgi:hypothetical protein
MLRLLVLLGISFYVVLAVFGDDRGQLRAGLRDTEPMLTVQSPPPASVDASVEQIAAATDTIPAIPHQALRVLPAPDQPTLAVVTEASAAQALLQTASIPAEETQDQTPAANISLRWVSVERANVRAQPGRNGAVTGRVERGEAVEVLWIEPSGWVRIRVQGDGVDGFVFGDLLTDIDPTAN